MKHKMLSTLLTLFLGVLTSCGQTKTTITVVNEDGTPVPGAKLKVTCEAYQGSVQNP